MRSMGPLGEFIIERHEARAPAETRQMFDRPSFADGPASPTCGAAIPLGSLAPIIIPSVRSNDQRRRSFSGIYRSII
jgi:hypothetical protein